ncbi:MAG: glycosyltransferase [Planctomycetes bacterium]|nr:glycosyltransferase [Planctomycetota bacterium]
MTATTFTTVPDDATTARAPNASPSRLSIVIPVYRGALTVEPLVHKLIEHLDQAYQLEIVLVNDASPDQSADVCRRLSMTLPQVKFVNLSRNFSEHNAVMAGLNHCWGDYAVIMDDDFQNPPSEVIKLVDEIRRGYDVVFAQYESKRHHPLRNLGSWFNNQVASILLRKPKDLYLSSFKAVNRFLIDEIIKYQGPYPYVDGLILRCTNSWSRVTVEHDSRQVGKSGYTMTKLVSLWLNMFTNFSILPLRLASCLGFLFAIIGLLIAIYAVIDRFIDPQMPSGWASLMVSILITSGVQLFALGTIGEYLGRLFLKDNGQPQFVVRERVNCELKPRART